MKIETMNTLFPYQIKHADTLERILRQNRVACDLSDPGTGKTYAACAVAARLGCPVAIICTKATVPGWKAVAEGFGVHPLFVENYEKLRTGKTKFCSRVEKRFLWSLPEGTLIIVDECQKCKGLKSLNAYMLIAAKLQQYRLLLCSATAASNPLEMKAFGFALGLHHLSDFYNWAMRNGVGEGMFGLEFRGTAEDLTRIHNSIFPHKGSRMRIADIESFPDTLIEATPIDTGKEKAIQSVYNRLHRELRTAEAEDDKEALGNIAKELRARRANALVLMTRARQEIELHKADAMAAMAKDAVEEGQSVVLLVNFDDTIDKLADLLNAHDSVIRGGQSAVERQTVINAFQCNIKHIVIANIQAGGVGVSLHDPEGRRPRLSLISPSFSATDIRQALGRVHRAGGAGSVQKILFAAGTVEEHTAKLCSAKLANLDLLNDGDLTPDTLL